MKFYVLHIFLIIPIFFYYEISIVLFIIIFIPKQISEFLLEHKDTVDDHAIIV